MEKHYRGYTKEFVCNKFFWHVRNNFKTQTEAAEHYGVTDKYISGIVREVSPPNEVMLQDIGFERKNGFVKSKK